MEEEEEEEEEEEAAAAAGDAFGRKRTSVWRRKRRSTFFFFNFTPFGALYKQYSAVRYQYSTVFTDVFHPYLWCDDEDGFLKTSLTWRRSFLGSLPCMDGGKKNVFSPYLFDKQ